MTPSWHQKLILVVMALFLCVSSSFAEPTIRPGWPVEVDNSVLVGRRNDLAIVQTDHYGPVIAISTGGGIMVLDLDGEFLPGWPLYYETPAQDGVITQGPRLGDMNGDGEFELAVRAHFVDWMSAIKVYSFAGEYLEELSTIHNVEFGNEDSSRGMPVFYDLDGNGSDELLFINDSLYAVTGTGESFPGFPWSMGGPTERYSHPVVIPDDSSPPIIVWLSSDYLHARQVGEEGEQPGFPVPIEPEDKHSPLTAHTTEEGWVVAVATQTHFFSYNHTGQQLVDYELWEVNASYHPFYISVGRFNEDDLLEWFFKAPNHPMYGITEAGLPVPYFPHEFMTMHSSEPITLMRQQGEEMATMLSSRGWPSSHFVLDGWQGLETLEGFPIHQTVDTHWPYGTSCALIHTPDDSLAVAHYCQDAGILYVYDLHMSAQGVTFEWPMPAGNAAGNRLYQPTTLETAVPETSPASQPQTLEIQPAYPNPGNGSVSMPIRAYRNEKITLQVYNVEGKLVYQEECTIAAGKNHIWTWDGRTSAGNRTSSGIYLVSIPQHPSLSQKLILLQ